MCWALIFNLHVSNILDANVVITLAIYFIYLGKKDIICIFQARYTIVIVVPTNFCLFNILCFFSSHTIHILHKASSNI